jgi:hypothetical protein
MATKTYNVMFDDLNVDAQDEVLKFYGMEHVGDGNWELNPLAILEVEEEYDIGEVDCGCTGLQHRMECPHYVIPI